MTVRTTMEGRTRSRIRTPSSATPSPSWAWTSWRGRCSRRRRTISSCRNTQGVDPSRLIFAHKADLAVHLARHALADLFLDTLPFNAHATACDALWAGLPVLTCQGESFCGRVGASLLSAAGLPELIADDIAAYEALALSLARDPEKLGAIRAVLQSGQSALFDTDRFRRNFEAALIQISPPAQ